MDICKNCGAPLMDGTAFCGFCGASVQAKQPMPAQPQAPVQVPVYVPSQPPVQPMDPGAFGGPAPDPGKTVAWSGPVCEPAPAPPVFQAPQAPAYRPANVPPVKKKKRSALTVLLSLLLCILMVLPVLPAFLLGTVSGSLNEDTYLQIILDVELSQLSGSLLDEDLEDMDLAEAICHEVNAVGVRFSGPVYWKDLTPDDIEQLLKETQLPEFAAEQLDRLTKAILSGKKSFKLRTKDVMKLLYEDLEVLVEDMDLPIDPDALEEAAEEIIHAMDAEEIPLEFDRETEEILDYVRKALSAETLTVLLAAVGVLILLLMLVNLRSPFHGLRDVGIVAIISGLLCLGITFLPGALSGLGDAGYLVSVVLKGLLQKGQLTAAVMTVGGAVLTIGSGVLRKLLKK